MAQCKPAPLCNHLMPTGKLCRGVALRDERYCRSHIRNHRLVELDRATPAPLSAPINFSETRMESMNYSAPLFQKTL